MPKIPKRRPARDARIEAMQMLGRWASLARGHVVLGGGCACGVGGMALRVEEFEQQILDFLGTKYSAARSSHGSLPALLRVIASEPAGERGESLGLLDDLKRTLDSFDELHRSG
jgi:hypothetical protein